MINKKVLFTAGAGIGGLASGILAGVLGLLESPMSSWVATGALDAALIGAFLVYVQNYYQSNSWDNTNQVANGIVKGLAIGAVGGVLAYISVMLFSDSISRLVGWAISGAAAGYVASLSIPNLKVRVALIAGAIGGALGLFVTSLGLSYTMGVGATGAVIGLMVALSEDVFRKMSIDVTINPITTGISLAKPHSFSLTLGEDPISVGFTSEMDIHLKTSGISMQKQIGNIYLEGEKVFYVSDAEKTKEELVAGTSFKIENAEVMVKGTA